MTTPDERPPRRPPKAKEATDEKEATDAPGVPGPFGRRYRADRKPGPNKGQKPFDPLSQTWVAQGQSWLARKAKADQARKQAEAEWLARHFQLDERGALPGTEKSKDKGLKEREERVKRLTDFPRIPEAEAARLEAIIKRYGLPLSALSSDTAAFVVRRVMMDFHRLTVLRRAIRTPMFTPDELIELMRRMRLKPTQLADMVAPGSGVTRNNALGSIHRWMHGASSPTSVLAIKLNRMIELHVRRATAGGYGVPGDRREEELSQKPQTVRRRAQKRRMATQNRSGLPEIPLSYAARKAREDADASTEPETPEADRP